MSNDLNRHQAVSFHSNPIESIGEEERKTSKLYERYLRIVLVVVQAAVAAAAASSSISGQMFDV